MNEPHLLDMTLWTATLNATISSIRQGGAMNPILLPGKYFACYNVDRPIHPTVSVPQNF
jgi:hypothetical protein